MRDNCKSMTPLDIAGRHKSIEAANLIINFLSKQTATINSIYSKG